MKRALLIANPNSAHGGETLDSVCGIFEQGGVVVDAVLADSVEHASRRIREAPDDIDVLLILGGDGTLHHLLPAVLERRLPVGVLPGGTANDYARGLGVPMDLEVACASLLESRLHHVDVAYAGDVPFLNAVHVGIVAKAASSASADAKRFFGPLAYLREALARLRRDPGFRVEVVCDGTAHHWKSIQVTAGNAPYFGGGNLVHADAALDDGHLYAYSVRPTNLMKLLLTGLLLRWGRGDAESGVDRISGRQLVVRPERSMEATADGESIGRTPIELRLDPGALVVLVPPTPSPRLVHDQEEIAA